MKTATAWCLKDPAGNLWPITSMGRTRRNSIGCYFSPQEWRKRYKRGWRCVRVEIKESTNV